MKNRQDKQEKQKLWSNEDGFQMKNFKLLLADSENTSELPQYIAHKVQYGDTLEGLSLQYSVSIGKIRYQNHIEGDSVYHLKYITIPNPKSTIPVSQQYAQTLQIEQFVYQMDNSDKSAKIAKYYLLQNDWNMQQALKLYKQDLEWERKNKISIASQPVQGNQIEMKQIKRFYDKMDLLYKKRQ